MKVALVNNGTSEPQKLLKLLDGHTIDIFPLEEAHMFPQESYDLVVLSGSSRFPIAYNKEKVSSEIELVQKTTTPIIGICFGCELIAVALGGTLKEILKEKLQNEVCVMVTKEHLMFYGRKQFTVYSAHRWAIDILPAELEELAYSDHGPEVIVHKTRPIFGFQFHPEKMTDETFGDEIFYKTLTILQNKK